MLSKGALSHVTTVSNESIGDIQEQVVPAPITQGDVADTIVSPVDSPSSTIAVPAEPTPETQPVDIQMVVETQDPTAMLGQAAQEQCQLQQRADELLDMQHACEQYTKLIRQTGLDGVSAEGAAFMKVGMQLINRSLGDNTLSLESYDDINPRSSRVKSTISRESFDDAMTTALVKGWEGLVRTIERIIALIRKGWEKFQDFGIDQGGKIDDALERIKSLKGAALSEEIIVNNPAMLFADGQLVYPEIRQLTGLAHFAFRAYPKALANYYHGLNTYLTRTKDFNNSEEEIRANIEALGKPLKGLSSDASIKELFNGNFRVDVTESELSFGMVSGDGAAAPSSVELPVEPPVKLRKTLTDLKTINALIVDYRAHNEKVAKAAEDLQQQIKHYRHGAPVIGKVIASIIAESAPRNREIAEFISKVTRAYLAVVNQMIEKHEKAGKA